MCDYVLQRKPTFPLKMKIELCATQRETSLFTESYIPTNALLYTIKY
jgi:hypothetical protein